MAADPFGLIRRRLEEIDREIQELNLEEMELEGRKLDLAQRKETATRVQKELGVILEQATGVRRGPRARLHPEEYQKRIRVVVDALIRADGEADTSTILQNSRRELGVEFTKVHLSDVLRRNANIFEQKKRGRWALRMDALAELEELLAGGSLPDLEQNGAARGNVRPQDQESHSPAGPA
jgi:hypothetical protein